jgi:hypothetical protein
MSTSAPRSGTLYVAKECSEYIGEAGSFCKITFSNFDAIRIGSKVVYAKAAMADGRLDSDIAVTPNDDTAYGHVLIDDTTQTGKVTLAGGTGELAKLAAELVVAPPTERNRSIRVPHCWKPMSDLPR